MLANWRSEEVLKIDFAALLSLDGTSFVERGLGGFRFSARRAGLLRRNMVVFLLFDREGCMKWGERSDVRPEDHQLIHVSGAGR